MDEGLSMNTLIRLSPRHSGHPIRSENTKVLSDSYFVYVVLEDTDRRYRRSGQGLYTQFWKEIDQCPL